LGRAKRGNPDTFGESQINNKQPNIMTNMQTPISKTILSIIGLLSAGSISFAQTGGDSNVLRRPESLNFYLEGTLGVINDGLKIDNGDTPSGLKNLFGSSLAFGWRIDQRQKIQLETGFYTSSATSQYNQYSFDYGTNKYTLNTIPVLFSYSYCFPLGHDGRWEIRVTPVAGFYSMKLKYTDDETYNGTTHYTTTETFSSTPLAFGVGAGVTWHFSRIFYADAGVRFLYRGSMSLNDQTGYYDSSTVKSGITSWLTASFGWKL